MNKLNPKIDAYIADGCGRCKYYATERCKVNFWRNELEELRQIAIESGLKEELKWSMPVYTDDGRNIFMISAFKDFCSINFFKGALLTDTKKLLVQQGPNSQTARIVKFNGENSVKEARTYLASLIKQAVKIEREGVKIETTKELPVRPVEMEEIFKDDEAFEKAFNSLSAGKQRGYILFFNQAVQAATRRSRILKNREKILLGKSLQDK